MTNVAQSRIDLILSKLPVHLDLTNRVSPERVVKARGGYGDVFQGRLRRIGSADATEMMEDALIIAIKSMRASLRTDSSFAKSFAKEMYVWAKLEHPNIVKLEGFILEDGYPSLISKWIGNGTVVEYIKEHPDRDLVRIALGIAKGIAYLHDECNVIHSDLKGANILVNANGQPMLTDFGLSRMVIYSQTFLHTTSYDATRGSTRWMAYELLSPQDKESSTTDAVSEWSRLFSGIFKNEFMDLVEGHDESEIVSHTKVSDIWAFGMVIYELLTGDIPYKPLRSDAQVILAIVNKKIPAMPNEMYDSRRALWRICEKCWVHSPKERLIISEAIHLLAVIPSLTEQQLDSRKRKRSPSPPRTSTGNTARRMSQPSSQSSQERRKQTMHISLAEQPFLNKSSYECKFPTNLRASRSHPESSACQHREGVNIFFDPAERHVKYEGEGMFRCKICAKLFTDARYAEEHLFNKHMDALLKL